MKPVRQGACLLVLWLFPALLPAADNNVFINFNFYPYLADVKSDSAFTLNTAVLLPQRFSYFSFANFGGLFESGPVRFLVSEQNLRWRPADRFPVDLVVQDTIRRGGGNDTVQAGVRWRLNDTAVLKRFFNAIHLRYSVHFFVQRWDQRDRGGWQVSHTYTLRFPYLSDRLYLGGFIDHNISERGPPGFPANPVISENQLGFRLYRRLYAVAEYRINQYRRSDVNNLGVGFEIKTAW